MIEKNQANSSEDTIVKEKLLDAARNYVRQGFSVLATKEDKKPVIKWTEDQKTLPTKERLQQAFQNPSAEGLAIVCGPVSKNLEVIDLDLKNDISGHLVREGNRVYKKGASRDISKSLHCFDKIWGLSFLLSL